MSTVLWKADQPYNNLPPLPPGADLETRAVLKQCIAARAALAELKQAAQLIPNQAVLINTLPLLESRASSEIENIVTTADKLFQHQRNPRRAGGTRAALAHRDPGHQRRRHRRLAYRANCGSRPPVVGPHFGHVHEHHLAAHRRTVAAVHAARRPGAGPGWPRGGDVGRTMQDTGMRTMWVLGLTVAIIAACVGITIVGRVVA